MKIIATFIALAFIGCNGDHKDHSDSVETKIDSASQTKNTTSTNPPATATAAFPTKQILAAYLQLKNALTVDNSKDAAIAANAIVSVLPTDSASGLSGQQLKVYSDLYGDMKENAEHIGTNADKIAHQREHFIMLSKDIEDFVKAFGNAGQTLYKDFCPMANEGKGAIWISETEEIKNPYFGKEMQECGKVKETFK